jgi:hypothetical protein
MYSTYLAYAYTINAFRNLYKLLSFFINLSACAILFFIGVVNLFKSSLIGSNPILSI